MRITQVNVNVASEGNLVAYVNIVFEDKFTVRGIRIVEKQDGRRLMLMPSRQTKAGDYKDICHAIDSDFRAYMEAVIMGKVEGLLTKEPAVPAAISGTLRERASAA